MSGSSITNLESKASDYIPTIDAFKQRLNYLLFNNRYVVEFGGSSFWNQHGRYVRFMVSAITIPSWMIDSEQTYIGGSKMYVPNGFTQGNLDLTIFNTGPELQVFQHWLKATYDIETRAYGYFDDLKCDLKVMQFTTDGKLTQEFIFTECTLYQVNGISFSYDPATAPQTFNVSLNYFGYTITTPQQYMKAIPDINIKTPEQLHQSATAKAAGAKVKEGASKVESKKKDDTKKDNAKKDDSQKPKP